MSSNYSFFISIIFPSLIKILKHHKMKIELFTELSYENETPPETFEININEELSIGHLLSEIHKLKNIPQYRELKWDDNIQKISCRYYYKSGIELDDYDIILNLEEKINTFAKCGTEGELSIFIDGSSRMAN